MRPVVTARMRTGTRAALLAGAAGLALTFAAPATRLDAAGETPAGMVRVPAGSYRPLYTPPRAARVSDANRVPPRRPVAAFAIDVRPVTNAQFLAFVERDPRWRRSRVKPLFADAGYLSHWRGDLDPGPDAPPDSPVVDVSWFAARAYLEALGKDLPTVDQWEYVAAASDRVRDASRDPAFLRTLLDWYGRPTPRPLPAVTTGRPNVYGVADLHGLIWEWTLDFNGSLVTGESRDDASLDHGLYCGGAAVGASNFADYAAFMRYAFRSSLEGRYTVANLGFRGVKTREEHRP